MSEYNLSFDEAIEKCFDNEGLIRGENFSNGNYVKNIDGMLVLINGSYSHKMIDDFLLTKSVYSQKYKLFSYPNSNPEHPSNI
ncbi:hypothetical protein EHS13_11710 [Paenibacillus psychroresistens]|uniref:Uncharacterized protein n=1 Tax=Paenibacillus psychroresistens TaxID=1778678 RepID=A0A6B8RHY4_9BACL|nr:hypothetical protein [Paenibacillus psychroresistens]QGQ95497.1 hypothetical protein EHS13_11710 [Paenibacillus psychroresistens]